MRIGEARAIIGSLGFPSKMPGTSWGISAFSCRAGSELAKIPGSIRNACFARRDRMTWRNAQTAYARRLAGIDHPDWVDAMTALLLHEHRKPYRRIDLGVTGMRLQRRGLGREARYRMNPMGFHRWFDTGDLQSVDHLEKIIEVCRRTPQIRHWLPTREVAILRAFAGAVPDNLTIRVSATMVDGLPPSGWTNVSAVHSEDPLVSAHCCPAASQGHECRDCRACWSRDVPLVSYGLH